MYTEKQQALFRALGILLRTVPLKRITVAALVQEAGVSRGTFYRVANGMPGFLDATKRMLADSVAERFTEPLARAVADAARAPHPRVAYPAFLALTRTIDTQRDLFRGLAAPSGDSAFMTWLASLLANILAGVLQGTATNRRYFAGVPADYAIPMFQSTVVVILTHWLRKQSPESPERVALLITRSRYLPPYALFRAE